MRHSLLRGLFCGLALSALAQSPALAQAQSKTKDSSSKAAEKPAEKKADPGISTTRKAADIEKSAADYRRVPQYFGQVDLTDEQREQIYAVREKYAAKQAQLEEQLETIRNTVLRESEAVLTPAQKTALNKLRGEAKAKAKAKSKANAKAAAKN